MLTFEMRGINALDLQPVGQWRVDDASLKCRPRTTSRAAKSLLKKYFEQSLEQLRVRLARVEENKVTLEDEANSKTKSPRSIADSDASGDSNATSNIIAGLYFMATFEPPGSDTAEDDGGGTSVATCESFALCTDAGYESVGSSAEGI